MNTTPANTIHIRLWEHMRVVGRADALTSHRQTPPRLTWQRARREVLADARKHHDLRWPLRLRYRLYLEWPGMQTAYALGYQDGIDERNRTRPVAPTRRTLKMRVQSVTRDASCAACHTLQRVLPCHGCGKAVCSECRVYVIGGRHVCWRCRDKQARKVG